MTTRTNNRTNRRRTIDLTPRQQRRLIAKLTTIFSRGCTKREQHAFVIGTIDEMANHRRITRRSAEATITRFLNQVIDGRR